MLQSSPISIQIFAASSVAAAVGFRLPEPLLALFVAVEPATRFQFKPPRTARLYAFAAVRRIPEPEQSMVASKRAIAAPTAPMPETRAATIVFPILASPVILYTAFSASVPILATRPAYKTA